VWWKPSWAARKSRASSQRRCRALRGPLSRAERSAGGLHGRKRSYIISGKIYEARTTATSPKSACASQRHPLRLAALEQAVKVQRGNGKRVLAMFSIPTARPAAVRADPAALDDITIYVFMYPVIRPELSEQSKAVWCSPDRSKAWLDLALRGNRPAANSACEGPVTRTSRSGAASA